MLTLVTRFHTVIVGTLDELTRLGGLQLKREEKLAAVVKEATTVLDEFTGVRPEVVSTVLRVRHTLGEAKLGAYPRDVAGDVMLARYHQANAPSSTVGHGNEDHAIHLAAIINSGLGERLKRGVGVARGEILEKDLVSELEKHRDAKKLGLLSPHVS